MRTPGKPAKTIPQVPRAGATLGIIAPASQIKKPDLEFAAAALQKLGFKTVFSDSIYSSELFFAGNAERRVKELHEMFKRADIDGILCARGGYGTNHLLSLIDLDIVRDNPKFFMGYSDVTTLLTYLCDTADLVTFHGPMAVSDREQFARGAFVDDVMTGFEFRSAITEQVTQGSAAGILYGGCLSMLAASLGTPYEINTEGTILFLEDIATKPYQIDRMLMQLKLASKLAGVKGICFGEMVDCVQPGGQDYKLVDVLRSVLGDLDVPIGIGMRSGHVAQGAASNLCLPLGLPVTLHVSANQAAISFRPK
jgi:muramoyltetrapeptide carboxypeptidase